jgi:hypothetical protein
MKLQWERLDDGIGMQRARVPGGWLYRGVRQSPAPHVTALCFVPDVVEVDAETKRGGGR